MDANGGTKNCRTLTFCAIPKSMTSGMPYINWDMDFSWDMTVDFSWDMTMLKRWLCFPFRLKSHVIPIGPFPPCRDEKAMVVGCTPNRQTQASVADLLWYHGKSKASRFKYTSTIHWCSFIFQTITSRPRLKPIRLGCRWDASSTLIGTPQITQIGSMPPFQIDSVHTSTGVLQTAVKKGK